MLSHDNIKNVAEKEANAHVDAYGDINIEFYKNQFLFITFFMLIFNINFNDKIHSYDLQILELL